MTTSYGTQSFHGVSSEDFAAAAHIVKRCRNMEPFSKSAGRGCLRFGLDSSRSSMASRRLWTGSSSI